MDKKIKLIAVGLGALCLAALGLAFFYAGKFNTLTRDYLQLEKERQSLRQENNTLSQKASAAQEEVSRLKEREASVKTELSRFVSERDDLQKRFDALSEERNKLIERLQNALAKGTSENIQSAPAQAVTGDQYWADVLKEKEGLALQLANLKDTIRANQVKMEELTRDRANLELDVQKMSKEKDEIQRQMEYNEKMADTLSLQLVREKDDKRKIEKQINLIKEENHALRSRLKEGMSTRVSLERKLKDTEDRRIELYNRMSQMDQIVQDKLSTLIDARQDLSDISKGMPPVSGSAVELPPIVVHGAQQTGERASPEETSSAPQAAPDNPEPDAQPLKAKIKSIDEENNFVIVDMGENQGVSKGQVLHVVRGSSRVATLEVIEVNANVSAADIKEKSADLKVGDLVK